MMRLPPWLGFGAVTCCAVIAAAEPPSTSSTGSATSTPTLGHATRIAVPTPSSAFTPHAQISQIIYLERCIGNCTVNKGTINDARTMTSTIPNQTSTVQEYRNAAGQTGSAADAEWAQVVQCVKEVYSPFDVMVTDQKPTSGVSFHMAIIAGNPSDIGQANTVLGIAPLAADCSAQDNVISFSFANAHGASDRVNNICWTASQESAHAFGLDHEYQFADGSSACRDPMTYRTDCGGEKFFRNTSAMCGEDAVRPCRCGANQNSHLKILSVFGPGTPITGSPTSEITLPVANGQIGAVSGVQAGCKRGIDKVELYVNGFKWSEAKGLPFGMNGQPNPGTYTIMVPNNLPGGVLDLVARAYDDLGLSTDSATVTANKGAPCDPLDSNNDGTPDSCATGQKCENGRCFWDPPSGALGDACTYPQFCTSLTCEGPDKGKICTHSCVPGVADSCESGFQCIDTGNGSGVCYFDQSSSGCCSVSDDRAVWAQGGLAALVVGILFGRRRRR